ncbi:hypothetical protein T03_6423 [Trichinella britovi]|uniref:Uncharacterized protein n=1 Tax=Trichinella britovi TaxID=45882 RepID=A0A0V1CA16_TRIBR|nr:hypothetical protein T03_6423 [Trichinella britovi]
MFITISRQIRIHATGFWKVSMQTNRYFLSKLSLKFACAYLNTQESSETDTLQKQRQYSRIFHFRHFSEVFVEIAQFSAIFLCFWQVDFSSFSVHLE